MPSSISSDSVAFIVETWASTNMAGVVAALQEARPAFLTVIGTGLK